MYMRINQRTGDCEAANVVRSLMLTIMFSALLEEVSKRSCFWYSGSSCGGLAMSLCDMVGGELIWSTATSW